MPKQRGQHSIDNFRPIMLLNFDYKTIARAIKGRLIPIAKKVIRNHQSCLPGRTIIDTVAEIRDIIGIVSSTNIRCALLFIDFSKAFDRVSHMYLLQIMREIGMENKAVRVFQNIITGITARIVVNGQMTRAVPLRRGVPQGSPLSMMLFAFSLEPFLRRLHSKLEGVSLSGVSLAVRAYADDVAVVIRGADDIVTTKLEIEMYSRVSGARINERKSKFLNLWGTEHMNIPWAQKADNLKTLGLIIEKCPLKMVTKNWKAIIDSMQGLLIESTWRAVSLIEKIKIINICIFSKVYYLAQLFPLPRLQAKKMMQLACRFIWKGNIFKLDPT